MRQIQLRKMLNKYIQPNLNTSVANDDKFTTESMQGRYSSSQYTASSRVLLFLSCLNSDGTDGFFGSWARGHINDFIWFPFQNWTAVWSECWFSILRLCWLWCTHKVTSAYFSKDILNLWTWKKLIINNKMVPKTQRFPPTTLFCICVRLVSPHCQSFLPSCCCGWHLLFSSPSLPPLPGLWLLALTRSLHVNLWVSTGRCPYRSQVGCPPRTRCCAGTSDPDHTWPGPECHSWAAGCTEGNHPYAGKTWVRSQCFPKNKKRNYVKSELYRNQKKKNKKYLIGHNWLRHQSTVYAYCMLFGLLFVLSLYQVKSTFDF